MNQDSELKSIIQEGDIHKTNNGENLVFNPFNPNNKEITKHIIESISFPIWYQRINNKCKFI